MTVTRAHARAQNPAYRPSLALFCLLRGDDEEPDLDCSSLDTDGGSLMGGRRGKFRDGPRAVQHRARDGDWMHSSRPGDGRLCQGLEAEDRQNRRRYGDPHFPYRQNIGASLPLSAYLRSTRDEHDNRHYTSTARNPAATPTRSVSVAVYESAALPFA